MAKQLREVPEASSTVKAIEVSGYDFRPSVNGYGFQRKVLLVLTLGGNLLPTVVTKGKIFIY